MKYTNAEAERPRDRSLERINAFSDGIFAIIITIMVLELKKPEEASFAALARLWHVWVSYLASYAFIAIVWVNHHYLFKNALHATPWLIWANFGHLFAVSLVPFLTAWMADTQMADVPVALYAFVFFLVNLTYLGLIHTTQTHRRNSSERSRRIFRLRSIGTLLLALVAVGSAFWHPSVGFGIVCGCMFFYLRPEAPSI
jgi:uncharacterized membrane protein